MTRIIVCMKVIIDPEMPFSVYEVDRETMLPVPPAGMPPVFSTFDENALEAALKIKDSQDCKITVLSMGKSLPKAMFRKVLAMGADDVIGIEGPEFDHLDPFSTAQTLVNAIKKLAKYDLIFTGRQGADWDAGLVWAGIAELLHIPSISIGRKAEINDGKLIVERCVSDGIEVLEVDMPALATFSSEVGEPRNISLPSLVKVKKHEIPKWSASEVGFSKLSTMEMRDLYVPDIGEIDCCLVSGNNFEDKGRHLARSLFEKGII